MSILWKRVVWMLINTNLAYHGYKVENNRILLEYYKNIYQWLARLRVNVAYNSIDSGNRGHFTDKTSLHSHGQF